jgi:hypothetical protein
VRDFVSGWVGPIGLDWIRWGGGGNLKGHPAGAKGELREGKST